VSCFPAPGRAALAAVLAFLLVVSAAHGAPPLVGVLPLGSPTDAYDVSLVEAFRQGLRDNGLVEGRDLVVEIVWTRDSDELAQPVLKLKQRGARVLVPVGTDNSMLVKRHATTIPMLFISVGNPLGIGLVENLARPGGHVTGFADNLADLGGKYVQFAAELVKAPAVVHYLWYDGWTDGHHRLQVTERAAQAVGVTLRPRPINDLAEVDEAMAAFKKAGASVVVVQPSPFTFRHRARLVQAGLSHGVATIGAFRPAARAGALVTYGPDYEDLYRRAASYLARILRGAKPGDLPVEQPTKFELLINLKTAKAVGIAMPPSLRARADHIID
jgi:putative ABC transport system substrate-binding protein